MVGQAIVTKIIEKSWNITDIDKKGILKEII